MTPSPPSSPNRGLTSQPVTPVGLALGGSKQDHAGGSPGPPSTSPTAGLSGKAAGGFVTGNLLASLVSGAVATLLLLITGVPYALPLGLFVVILDLVPYRGPAVITMLLATVALSHWQVRALLVFGVLLGYHLIEGHTLRPLLRRAQPSTPVTLSVHPAT